MFPDFARFFELCHDAAPYRWQVRLAKRVLSERCWPSALDLPTGAGKTSVIDIALYALAATAHAGEPGAFPRRIIVTVDRRILVDQTWAHADRLLRRIGASAALEPIRRALDSLSPEERPNAVRLRGACPTDPRWCRSPDQVQIVASTIDQIGSRMLLRGYGVTPRMRSVEAGLVGQDAILFLDEVHLAGPFLDTLNRLDELDPVRIAPRRHVVPMSATPVPTAATREPFALQPEDYADKAIAPRLRAKKVLQFSNAKVERALREIDAPCVLLVANTVRTALAWFDKAARLRTPRRQPPMPERERFLVTGRTRPFERQRILDAVERRLKTREPTLVVATQCVEAGVDWDFDAMISECASWDALVQRMGRVNRRGNRPEGSCLILPAQRLSNRQTQQKCCPVYGEHEIDTANWLDNASPIDCTPGSMPEPPSGCVRPPSAAPPLIPEYLDLWSQNRANGPAFDVSVFLHGVTEYRHVQVVWRDLDLACDGSFLKPLLKTLPPSSLEAVSVPIWEFRQWLGERSVVRVGPEPEVRSAQRIGVGATVVVPSDYGGIGAHGTFDGATDAVADISADALRVHRNLHFQFHDAPPTRDDEPLENQVESWISEDDSRSELREWTWVDLGRRWLFVSHLPIDDDDDGPTFRRRAVSLESHLNGVEARTRAVAERLGLPSPVTADLALAARLHDIGKLDERFQRLCGRAPSAAPLGKSAENWVARRRREALSDYPKDERHEALSVELMIRYGLHATANDPQLVEHLVASHHGWARPFIRSAQGTARIDDRLFDVDFAAALAHEEAERAPARFHAVQKRFGWLGLSWLEAIVQLADHRQSEAEERGEIASAGGESLKCCRSDQPSTGMPAEVTLAALNGLVPGDFLATIGVLRALDLAEAPARLRWEGMLPRFATDLDIDEIVDRLVTVRECVAETWPAELNKLSDAQCNELLLGSTEPFRSLVVAMLSSGGRSEMDFVSGGRGGFKDTYDWSINRDTKGFSAESLRCALIGPRSLSKGGKSFRWTPLAAQGAHRPKSATDDKRTEPWIEWLSLMGVSALVSVPESRSGRLATRSTAFYGRRRDKMHFRWPLWRVALRWHDIRPALAGTRSSLVDALWCGAPRLEFGKPPNTSYGLGVGSPLCMRDPRDGRGAY